MKKIIAAILALISIYNIGLPIINNFGLYTEKFNPKLYEKKYNNSQYVIPQSKQPISDEELLSYAGYKYATGLNPILINSDHPPFGKYIIGWFTLITGNNRIVSLFFGFSTLVITMYIIWLLTKSYLLVALGFFMVSVDTIFLDQILHSPVLDIIHVFFLLLYFLLCIKWLEKKSLPLLIAMGLTLGAFASTKLYFPAIVLLFFSSGFLILLKKPLKKVGFFFVINVGVAFLFYLASYTSLFLHGNSLRAFFGAQKWIFLFWRNNSINTGEYFGNILPLVLFNKWHVWWGTQKYISFEHWTIFWAVFFIFGIIAAGYFIFINRNMLLWQAKKIQVKDEPALLLSLWTVVAVAYLMFIPVSPRYLMIIYFPMYITITCAIKKILATYV